MQNLYPDYIAELDARYARLLTENHKKYFYDEESLHSEATTLLYEVLLIVGLRKTAEASIAWYQKIQDIPLDDTQSERVVQQ